MIYLTVNIISNPNVPKGYNMKKYIILIISLCSSISHAALDRLIESINLEKHKVTYSISRNLRTAYFTEDLFVEYEKDIDLTKLDYTIYTIPLVLNVISTIWISGKIYTIEAMDKDLYESLKIIKKVFKRLYPQTAWDGELIADLLVENRGPNVQNDIITIPFSHGLDSVCTSFIYHNTPQLLLTIRGMPDIALGEKEDCRWEQTKNLVAQFAKNYGHQNTYIYSNFHDFFNWNVLNKMSPEIPQWRLYAVEDLGWIGMAAPILATHGYNKLLLVSNIGATGNHPGASGPLVANNVTVAGITCRIDSFEKSRLDKNKTIADICNTYHIEKPLTLVCTQWLDERKNCCRCQKCCITMISFLVLGEDPKDYGFEMDLPSFFDYYRNVYYYKNKYSVYRAGWNKDCQKMARERFASMNPLLQNFFSWYNAIDFDRLAIPTHNIPFYCNDFIDIYNETPQGGF